LTAAGILTLVLLPLSWPALGQQNRWVSDQLPLDMRSGPSNAHRVIKMLEPGTRVKVLQVDRKAEFSEVMISNSSTRGWLANRYLSDQPSAREQLEQAKATAARLSADVQPLKEEIARLKQDNATLQQQLEESTGSRSKLEQDLAHVREVSADAVALDETNQSLIESNQLLQHELDVLKAENERLGDSSRREWFLYGAFAVALGALLTLIIPRFTRKRSSNEWR
jgi:SH3 domain protein